MTMICYAMDAFTLCTAQMYIHSLWVGLGYACKAKHGDGEVGQDAAKGVSNIILLYVVLIEIEVTQSK